jgi:hypothetical protein
LVLAGLFTIIFSWPQPDPNALKLCREAGAEIVITNAAERAPAHEAGMRLVAEIPADTPLAALGPAVEKARAAGFDGAAVTAIGESAALRKFIDAQKGFVQFVYLKSDQLGWDVAPAKAVLRGGLWPGLQMGSVGEAAATEKPWLNGNMHLYSYLRSMYPGREALLSFPPDEKSARYEGAEIALSEAFASGGTAVLSLPEMYRTGLLQGDSRAVSAWKQLAQVGAFLKQQQAVQRTGGAAKMAISAGALDEGMEEILNLSYRANLGPEILPAGKLRLAGKNLRIVVAAGVPVNASDARELVRFATEGGIVVTAPEAEKKSAPWWGAARKLRTEGGRDIYQIGKGFLHSYPDPVIDPSEFARDLKEISGLDNPSGRGLMGLDLRVWANASVLGMSHARPGGKLVVLVSYGRWSDGEFLLGVRGRYASAEITDAAGVRKGEVMPRGERVELNVKGLKRVALITFEEKAR